MRLAQEHTQKLCCIGIHAQPDVNITGSGLLSTPCALWAGIYICGTNVGHYSYVVSRAELYNCSIGNYTSIGKNCTILSNHPMERLTTSPVSYAGLFDPFPGHVPQQEHPHTRIGSDVWIGANVCLKSGVQIGHGAVIGAGTVVTKNIPAYAVAVGTPARVIRQRFPNDLVQRMLASRWFDYDWKQHLVPWATAEASLEFMEHQLQMGHGVQHGPVFSYDAMGDTVKFEIHPKTKCHTETGMAL